MTIPAEDSRRTKVGAWAAVSVLLLTVMCALYLGTAESLRQEAVWYTTILSAPYLFVIVACLASRTPPPFVFGLTSALARVAFIGTIILTAVTLVGLALVVFQIPSPLFVPSLVGLDIAGKLNEPGLVASLGFLIVQWLLGRAARGRTPDPLDKASLGSVVGHATLLLPAFIFLHINIVREAAERRAIQALEREEQSRKAVIQESVERKSAIALEVARASLHRCVYSGCLDSLTSGLGRDSVAFVFKTTEGGHFGAVLAASKESRVRFVTNETGVVLQWRAGLEPFQMPRRSSPLDLLDSTYADVWPIGVCIRNGILGQWDEFPLHLPRNRAGCGMMGDTTVMQLRHAGEYRFIYSSPRAAGGTPTMTFGLTARPVNYGSHSVRSFLITQDSVYVTTADRLARKSDFGVDRCDLTPKECARPD